MLHFLWNLFALIVHCTPCLCSAKSRCRQVVEAEGSLLALPRCLTSTIIVPVVSNTCTSFVCIYFSHKKNHFMTHGSTFFMLTCHKLSNSKSSSCTTHTTCPFHVHSHAMCTAVAQTRETLSAVCLSFALCTSA